MKKFKKGDEVYISAGKDRGKRGKIEKVLAGGSLFIPSLNVYKRHLKKRGEGAPSGIISLSRPLPPANVALVCPKCAKPTRIGFRVEGDKKSRVCAKCKSVI